eukprot:1129505-Rhodomonas_salina.2
MGEPARKRGSEEARKRKRRGAGVREREADVECGCFGIRSRSRGRDSYRDDRGGESRSYNDRGDALSAPRNRGREMWHT